jgi:S-DNA-T family DNA segregation ATPase FtsK/SpoIIIE
VTKRLEVDWSDWSFGPGRHPVIGAAMAGLTALSVTSVGAASGLLPAGWPLVAGAVLGCAAAVTAAWRSAPGQAVAYRAGCWVAAGGWSSWTLTHSSPWSRWPLILLATGVALAAVIGSGLAWLEDRQQPDVDRPAPERDRDPVAARWEERLRQITRRQIVVDQAERWDPPTGFTLHCTLPGDGTTVADVKAYEAQLASAANLPPGCNVEVLGTDRGRRFFTVRVATVNAIAETRHLDDATSPLSIENPLPLGDYADRSPAAITLRFACCVLVGQTDSGKSNTLNVITHQLGRCTDALIWAVDCSGNGRFPRPWVRAWREGRATAPVIDWAAVTPEEARRLTAAAVSIINGRTAAYEQMMHQADDDKLPVSPEVPEIVILVDEFADLPADVKETLETISNTGRGAGVRVVSSVLRAIGADISRAMIVQARERIAMRVSDEAELQYLFDAMWSRGRFDPASMPYRGSGALSTGASPAAPFKVRRLKPARIEAASIVLGDLRPGLDPISVELAGAAYPGRWEQTLPLMFPAAGRARPDREQAAGGGTVTATLTRPEETVNLDESAKRLRDAVDAARQAREEADADPATDWTVVEGWLSGAPTDLRLPPRARMRQIVQEHRRDGIGPRAVWQQMQAEDYRTVEQTVIGWMRADAQAGVLAQPGGRGTAYVPGPSWTLDQPS